MSEWQPSSLDSYKWIISDPELLGGKLAIRGTRFTVSFILACLAEGMSPDEIQATYGPFPQEALPEIMRIASEALDKADVTCYDLALKAGLIGADRNAPRNLSTQRKCFRDFGTSKRGASHKNSKD